MTCIAFDGKTVAADGRMADDAILSSRYKKIFRAGELIIGVAGDVASLERVRAWVGAGCPQEAPPKVKDCSILFVHPNARVFVSEDGAPPMELDSPTAIGSGRNFALAAMDLGFDALTAVRSAIKRDPLCGGQIRTLKINASA